MIKYERVMTGEEFEEFSNAFFSKDWRDVTISPEILGWNEIYVTLTKEGLIRATAWLHESRVHAGVLLTNRGFNVV